MITLWAWTTFLILVFCFSCFNYLETLLDLVEYKSISHPPGRTILVITFILFFPLSILVNSSFTSPCYCDQDTLIPIFNIHDFSVCVTGIFSLVTGDDVICDPCILGILTSNIHNLPEFSLCDYFHVPSKICFRGFSFHDVHRVIFTQNMLDINILVFQHVLQKIMVNINMFCTNTYLPVIF